MTEENRGYIPTHGLQDKQERFGGCGCPAAAVCYFKSFYSQTRKHSMEEIKSAKDNWCGNEHKIATKQNKEKYLLEIVCPFVCPILVPK